MSYLRELLKSHEPELNTALENAWKVAHQDVFPVLYSTDESLNSSPHCQNIEDYLDSIFGSIQDIFNEESPVHLTPYELYCILMAILFHDIGRIMCEIGHGSFSKLYIKNNYQKFFIPAEELADIIADICDYHKSIDKDFKPSSTLLDAGKGRIRTRELSELLILVDEMDTTYRRLKNLYVLDQPKYYTGKGQFRNYIKGVNYNHLTKSVIVSIDNKIEENTNPDASYDSVKYFDKQKKEKTFFSKSNYPNDLIDYLIKKSKIGIKLKDERREIFNQLKDGKLYAELEFDPMFIKTLNAKISTEKSIISKTNDKERLDLIDGILKVKSDTNKMKLYYAYRYYINKGSTDSFLNEIELFASQKWPIFIVLPTILNAINNCQKNTLNLQYISRLGIQVKKWSICYKEHLFDTNGMETIEPVLSYDFVKKVIKNMWDMSNQIFGETWFSFTDLSSKVHEKDIDRLKLAVQRIEIITRDLAIQNGLSSSINYDNRKWCWIREGTTRLSVTDVIKIITIIQNKNK